MTYNVFGGTLSLTQSMNQQPRRQRAAADHHPTLRPGGGYMGLNLLRTPLVLWRHNSQDNR